VIRLGSTGGHFFEGPRVLAGWTPPELPGVYAILYKPDEEIEQFAVIYIGHSDDMSKEGFPFKHPKAGSWVQRAGSKYKLHIATRELHGVGVTRGHREQLTIELLAQYDPHCNSEKFDHAWKREWIGDYDTPNTTAPLTTTRASVSTQRAEPTKLEDWKPTVAGSHQELRQVKEEEELTVREAWERFQYGRGYRVTRKYPG
jgi:hypothetical protein